MPSPTMDNDAFNKLGALYPIYSGLFASAPAASAVKVGAMILVTDFPTPALFTSDGTYWRPVNGSCIISQAAGSLSVPAVTGPVAGGAFTLALPKPILIPAGLLIPGQSTIDVLALFTKIGSAAAINASMWMGTANNQTDSLLASNSMGTGTHYPAQFTLSVAASGRVSVQSVNGANVIAANATTDGTTNINTAAAMNINFGSAASTAPDGLNLLRYRVELNQ